MTSTAAISQAICKLFDIKKLKPYQEKAFETLVVQKKDCFVCQPTGSGKSITFQAMPFYKHALELIESGTFPSEIESLKVTCPYKVIVISLLLNSLMSDQQMQLSSRDFNVCCLREHNEQGFEDVKASNVIFTSPEAILAYYRRIFREDVIQTNIIGFAVDESHCIKNWGSSSHKANAFQENYSQLSELRSLVLSEVPVLALTATATKDTKEFVIDNLCMFNPVIISSTPERQNIKFHVVNLKDRDIEHFFDPIATAKVLIFCRVMKDVRDIYKVFDRKFRRKFPTYKTRPYAMFHSKTEEEIKSHVLQEFSKSDGTVRILIATIAFGIGVNCRGLYSIIHFGPPASLEDYFQEAGRAGRDGGQSHAVLASYPRCMSSKNISQSIKKYCKNDTVCRRKAIFNEFGETYVTFDLKHLCCDVCEVLCECKNCPSSEVKWWNQTKTADSTGKTKGTLLHKGQEKFIRNGLIDIRKSILPSFKGLCGNNIMSGFPIESIEEVLNIAYENITEDDIKCKTCVFNEDVHSDIVSLVQESFRLESEYDIVSEQSDASSVFDETDDDEASDESSDDTAVDFHVRLRLSSDSESDC